MNKKDIFEDMRSILKTEYLSDIRYVNQKRLYWGLLKLNFNDYSEKQIEELFEYILHNTKRQDLRGTVKEPACENEKNMR